MLEMKKLVDKFRVRETQTWREKSNPLTNSVDFLNQFCGFTVHFSEVSC